MKEKINNWKLAFFILLGCIGLVLVTLMIAVYFLSRPMEYNLQEDRLSREIKGETVFTISTTKEKLNLFLHEQMIDDAGEQFQISLSDYIVLETRIPFLGREISVQLDLEPEIYQGGNLLLKKQSFHVGFLQLPSKTLFQLIQNNLQFPDWIEVDADGEVVYVKLTEMDTMEKTLIKVKKFDLHANEIEFELAIKETER